MLNIDEDTLQFLGFNKDSLGEEKDVTKALYKHLDRLSMSAFKDCQLLIGNLLVLARDACDCGSEYFLPICARIKEECDKQGYSLKK